MQIESQPRLNINIKQENKIPIEKSQNRNWRNIPKFKEWNRQFKTQTRHDADKDRSKDKINKIEIKFHNEYNNR